MFASQPMCQLPSTGVDRAVTASAEPLVEVDRIVRPAGVAAPTAMKPAMALVVRRIAESVVRGYRVPLLNRRIA